MNICFYAGDKYWGGLRNCGGSKTILSSAEILRLLGHHVDVIAVNDKFTWFEHPPIKHKINKSTDAIIAIAISDIEPMIENAKNIPKFYWMRGVEKWQMREGKIIRLLKKRSSDLHILVNSVGLNTFLGSFGIKSTIAYGGLDIGIFVDQHNRPSDVTVGFLYNTTHRTKRWDLCEEYWRKNKDKKYIAIGAEKYRGKVPLVKYYKNPGFKGLVDAYNQCHYWYAPTELEGFHNVAAEAVLCGCELIRSTHKLNGMWDFTGTSEEARAKLLAIGSRTDNMKKLVEILARARERGFLENQ